MTNKKQKNNLLPFEVISEATKGNVDALCTVLRHLRRLHMQVVYEKDQGTVRKDKYVC